MVIGVGPAAAADEVVMVYGGPHAAALAAVAAQRGHGHQTGEGRVFAPGAKAPASAPAAATSAAAAKSPGRAKAGQQTDPDTLEERGRS